MVPSTNGSVELYSEVTYGKMSLKWKRMPLPSIRKHFSCVYGHPAASKQYELHNQGVYDLLGFTRLRSTPSCFQIPETPLQDQVISGVTLYA